MLATQKHIELGFVTLAYIIGKLIHYPRIILI